MNPTIHVEVVYALPQQQRCIELVLPAGSTALQAIEQSGLLAETDLLPEQLKTAALGIYGQKINSGTRLKDGDRVEIYRPLLLSPTEARRLRAQTMVEKGDS